MKFNWGTGIFLFYGLFATMLIFQVIKSTQYDHSLVVDEYYAEDLAYQEKYDRIQSSLNLDEPVAIAYDEELQRVIISFPFTGEALEGKVLFYRPSTSTLDVQFPLRADVNGNMVISTADLLPGRWRVEINWNAAGTKYYDEQEIDLIGNRDLADRS